MRKPTNLRVIRRYYDEMWNKWDFALVDELISPEIRFRGSLGTVVQGTDGFRQYMESVRSAFPDFHNTLEETISDREKVVARLTYRGTHQGEVFGIKPTHSAVTYSGVAIFTLRDWKVVEGWVLGDILAVLQQLLGSEFWLPEAARSG